MDLDVFLSEQNIRRYRRLLLSSVTPTERKTIFKLLTQEMDALRSNAPRTANLGRAPRTPIGRVANDDHQFLERASQVPTPDALRGHRPRPSSSPCPPAAGPIRTLSDTSPSA